MDDLTSPTGREEALRALPRDAADGQDVEAGTAPRALVLGATGYLGGRLVPRLLNGGYVVRVLARDAHRVAAFDWGSSVEVVEGDATDPKAMAEAARDVDVLYYLVHSMGAGKGFEAADRDAATTVAEAAAAASVGRIVYLGGLHPEGVQLSPHLRSRVEVGQILLDSGVPTLVLQAGVVIGSGSASFEMVRHLTEVLPYMPAPKWVRNRIQPIAVRDVLHYLLGAARVDADVNTAVDIGGPDVLRYGQMMNGYAVEAGLKQRGIAALPVLTPRLASHWVNLVTPIPRRVAMPLVESLQNECVVKNRDVDALIPRPEGGLTPYRRAVDLALGKVKLDAIETSWQDGEVLGVPSDPLPNDPDWAGKTVFTDKRTARPKASPEALWRVVQGIGGERGWYSNPLLWAIRGWADKLVGGVGPSPRAPPPRPAGRRRCGRLLARRGDRAGLAAAPAGRDEGSGTRVARDARRPRRRRFDVRPAGGLLPARPGRAAVLARGAAVPRVHLRRHGEQHHGRGRSGGCRAAMPRRGRSDA